MRRVVSAEITSLRYRIDCVRVLCRNVFKIIDFFVCVVKNSFSYIKFL